MLSTITSPLHQLHHVYTVLLSTILYDPWLTSGTLACGLVMYYCVRVVKVPEVVGNPSSRWHQFLMKHVPLLQERFWCSVWCYEARAQTVAAALLHGGTALRYNREIIQLSDGGQLCLDWILEDGETECVKNSPSALSTEVKDQSSSSTKVKDQSTLSAKMKDQSAPSAKMKDQSALNTEVKDQLASSAEVNDPSPSRGALKSQSSSNDSEYSRIRSPDDEEISTDSNHQSNGDLPSNRQPISEVESEAYRRAQAATDEEAADTLYPITNRPILIVLPGLTGSSASEYVKDFVRAGQKTGYKCVVFNNRGKGGVPLKTPRTYCAANCDDFAEAIEQIVARYQREQRRYRQQRSQGLLPSGGERREYSHGTEDGEESCYSRESPRIAAIGISLGGMIVSHYIIGDGAAAPSPSAAARRLTFVLGVSVPYNVVLGTANLERPWLNLALNRHLAQCLVDSVVELQHSLKRGGAWDYDSVIQSRTIREFDSRFTAVQFGYRDVHHYYDNASLHDKLHRSLVPYIGLSAEDDPFQPRPGLPLSPARRSKHVALVVTSRGGHIGFLEGFRGKGWAGRLAEQVLGAARGRWAEVEEMKG